MLAIVQSQSITAGHCCRPNTVLDHYFARPRIALDQTPRQPMCYAVPERPSGSVEKTPPEIELLKKGSPDLKQWPVLRRLFAAHLFVGIFAMCGWLASSLRADDAQAPAARELYQRAAAALLAKNLPLASAELGRLVEQCPEDELAPLAALRLAECQLAQGDSAAAVKLLKTWMPKLTGSERTLALEPTALLRAQFVFARAHFLDEDFQAVIKLAREQADIHARRSSLTAAETSLLEQLHALSVQAKKRREQALGTELRLAAEQLRHKRYSEALCTLEQCDSSRMTPAWRWRFHVLHAQCIAGQGDVVAALKELDAIDFASLTETECTAVHIACLDAAIDGQLIDRAEREIEFLKSVAEKDEQLGATVALRTVEVATFRKNRSEARRLAEAAKQAYPKFASVHEFDLLLARNAIADIQFGEARQILTSLIISPPANDPTAVPRAQWLLGESYFLTQNYVEAIAAYSAVIDSGNAPTWTETSLMQRGKCYELTENPTAAAADYQRLLNEFEQSRLCPTARERLAGLETLRSAATPPTTLNK